jgi:hypothetical protein
VADEAVLAVGRHGQRKRLDEPALGKFVPSKAQPRQCHALAGQGRGEREAEVHEARAVAGLSGIVQSGCLQPGCPRLQRRAQQGQGEQLSGLMQRRVPGQQGR